MFQHVDLVTSCPHTHPTPRGHVRPPVALRILDSRCRSLVLSLSLSRSCLQLALHIVYIFLQSCLCSRQTAAGAAASTRLLRCPLPSAFDILHIRFILQLQYLICSYHANFHPIDPIPVQQCPSSRLPCSS